MTLTQSDLQQFMGCNQPFFDRLFAGCFYTDGIKFLREHCGWVVTDVLAHIAYNPKLKDQEFIVIKVDVEKGFIGYEGIDTANPAEEIEIERQEYDLMDFPFNFTMYAGITQVGDTVGKMLMLPSEY